MFGSFFIKFEVTVFGTLRSRVGKILFDLHCPYFSSEELVKLTRRARAILQGKANASLISFIVLP